MEIELVDHSKEDGESEKDVSDPEISSPPKSNTSDPKIEPMQEQAHPIFEDTNKDVHNDISVDDHINDSKSPSVSLVVEEDMNHMHHSGLDHTTEESPTKKVNDDINDLSGRKEDDRVLVEELSPQPQDLPNDDPCPPVPLQDFERE